MIEKHNDPASLSASDENQTLELARFEPENDKSPDKRDELIGRILNAKYAIVERIGESASIAVYKALVLSSNRHVVVKTLKFRDPAAIEWLRARASEQIGKHNPNIVDTIDYLETPDGRPFLVTELVEGITLAELLKSNEYVEDEHEIADLVRGIGNAIQYAHAHNFCHGNLTPRNVFLFEADGNVVVKVSDFGIARELWQQDGPKATESLDIYQLGLLTYLLSTGHLPHANMTYDQLMFAPAELETRKHDPLSYHRSDLYCLEQFNEVVETAIEIGEEWRQEKVSEFLEGINAWLHGVEGAQVVRSHLVQEIADLPANGERPRRDTTGQRNMRTTIRKMIDLRVNLSSQEDTIMMKFTGGAAAKGPRRSPLATAGRLILLCACLGGLAYSVYYISTDHSETVRDLWMKSSRQLSMILHKEAPPSDEPEEATEAVAKPIAPSDRHDGKKANAHKLAPAFKDPTPKSDPQTISEMYRAKNKRFQGNNARNIDQKSNGFRIDYRCFNNDWLKN